MITGRPGRPRRSGSYVKPTPPSPDRPAFLTHRQLETLFHGMGLCLRLALNSLGPRGTATPGDLPFAAQPHNPGM
ncbi:MAG: hypothetical protein JNM66_07260 [Bryobacterales bacterium]|nr:hypothetical protein [Bryobacterales bacterium]